MKLLKSLVLASLIVLAGCAPSKTLALYQNYKEIVDGDLTITFEYTNYGQKDSLGFSLYFLSTDPNPYKIKVSNYAIYRERDNAKYGVMSTSFIASDEMTLHCDMKSGSMFITSLPTSTSEDKYNFSTSE